MLKTWFKVFSSLFSYNFVSLRLILYEMLLIYSNDHKNPWDILNISFLDQYVKFEFKDDVWTKKKRR